MKIRTDFVTNSSSSSFCVSLGVETVGNKNTLTLDLWPEEEYDCVFIPARTDLDEFIARIKACSTVEELKRLLINHLDFSKCFIDFDFGNNHSNEEILKVLAECLEEEDEDSDMEIAHARQISEAYARFEEGFAEINSLSDIGSITVKEFFTGYGEGNTDALSVFIMKAFKGRLKKTDIGKLTACMGNTDGFRASIITTINLETKCVSTKYEFEPLTSR